SLLTRRTGLVRAVGKGVRRTRSRFGARLEPFTHIDVQLHAGKSLDVVTQVDTLHAYGSVLVTDYPRYTAGVAMLETADKVVSVPRLVLEAYRLRSLAVAGYAPALEECAHCGVPGPHREFAVHAGGMVCSLCRPAGSVKPSPAAVALMVALLRGDWESADASAERDRTECSGLVAAYLQWHLENGVRSLRLVERA